MPGAESDDVVVVVRFRPFGLIGLQNSVTKQVLGDEVKGRVPRHGVSAFADKVRAGESLEEAVDRICRSAKDYAGGPKVAFVTEAALNEQGYCLHESVPPELHYLIGGKDLHQPPPDLQLLEAMLQPEANRRDNPAFEKGES